MNRIDRTSGATANMTLRSMLTNSNDAVPLDGLTVLVGPNNVGKSQTLRDIHRLITNPGAPTVLLQSLDYDPPVMNEYLDGISQRRSKANPVNTIFSAIDSNLQGPRQVEVPLESVRAQFSSHQHDWIRNQFGAFRVAFLDAGSRLLVASSGPSYDAHETDPATLLQHLYLKSEVQDELDRAFHETFKMHIRLDYSGLLTLSLRVASEFSDIPVDPRDAHPIMSQFPRLDEQGDGFRSFVGVVL